MTIITIILAALGLTFLIFIHELGHYVVARREGMIVDVFSIGFGPAFFSFNRKGVRWQFCYILIGGYVKVRGMEKEGDKEPYEIENGFASKSPWARIKMAAMGPIVNIVFAFLAFSLIWASGGRAKPFSEFTHLLGWVNHDSPAAKSGVRAGDRLKEINGKPYMSAKDLLYASVVEESNLKVTGDHINYFEGSETPYTVTFPKGKEEFSAVYMMQPASLMLYEESQSKSMQESGIQKGDRILWADGQLLFSQRELLENMSEGKSLLTVERRGITKLIRVPRMQSNEIKFSKSELGELDDWQHVLGMSGNFYFIPYAVSSSGVVERNITYLNGDLEETQDHALQQGDRIVAIDGEMVTSGSQILNRLQSRHIQLIVQRVQNRSSVSASDADKNFINTVDWKAIPQIAQTIGLPYPKQEVGDIHLLKPIELIPLQDLSLSEKMQNEIASNREAIAKIKDPKMRSEAVKQFETFVSRPTMGALLLDEQVLYNPTPIKMFQEVVVDTYQTLGALVTGYLKPKYLSGPVGIVRIIQHSVHVGWKEALYFLGLISLNLGIFNLLPIPVLDGGHITFSIIEAIRKKPMKAKTMERLIIPFVVMIIIFFIFVTYQDITRIFK